MRRSYRIRSATLASSVVVAALVRIATIAVVTSCNDESPTSVSRSSSKGQALVSTNVTAIAPATTTFVPWVDDRGTAIARGSDTYFLAYLDGNDGWALGARVRLSDGALVELPRTLLPDGTPLPVGRSPAAAFDGGRFVVSLGGPCSGAGFITVRESDGAMSAPTSVALPDCYSEGPVGFDGTNFVASVMAVPTLTADLVSVNTSFSSRSPIVLDTDVIGTSFAIGNGVVLGAWLKTDGTVYVQRRQAGSYATIDTAAVPIANGIADIMPFVAFDGARFLVSFSSSDRVFGVRIEAATGKVLDASPFDLTSTVAFRGLIGSNGQFAVVETDGTSTFLTRFEGVSANKLDAQPMEIAATSPAAATGSSDEYAIAVRDGTLVRVSPTTGKPTSQVSFSVQPSSQFWPALAFGANGGLVAWWEAGAIRAMPIDASGAPRASASTLVGVVTPSFAQPFSIVHDGTNFVVAWGDDDGVHVTRIDDDGTVVDAQPLTLQPTGTPLLATTQGTTLVAWGDRAVRVKNGSALDSTALMIPARGILEGVDAVDGDFILYSYDNCTHLVGRMSASTGTLAAVSTLVDGECQDPLFPGGGAGTTHDLVVSRWSSGPGGAVVRLAGSADSIVYARELPSPSGVAVFDSVSVLVRGYVSDDAGSTIPRWWRVRRADGALLTPTQGRELWPSDQRFDAMIASSGIGKFVAVFMARDEHAAMRIYSRAIAFSADGATCDSDDDCASTSCVAQLCTALAGAADAAVDGDAAQVSDAGSDGPAADVAADAGDAGAYASDASDATDAGDASSAADASSLADAKLEASTEHDASGVDSPHDDASAAVSNGPDSAGEVGNSRIFEPDVQNAPTVEDGTSSDGGCAVTPSPRSNAGTGIWGIFALGLLTFRSRRRAPVATRRRIEPSLLPDVSSISACPHSRAASANVDRSRSST